MARRRYNWHPRLPWPPRRRSRSPFDRDRRDRPRSPPPRRSPLPGVRIGASYRPRSRSPERPDRRGDDRYGPSTNNYRQRSPIRQRESAIASAITSRSGSRISSPRPVSRGAPGPHDARSRQQSPLPQSPAGLSGANAIPVPVRTATPRSQTPLRSPPRAKSPPRGPAALRAPPTGPSASRSNAPPINPPAPPRHPPTPVGAQQQHSRSEATTSPTVPPAGPRGYVPPPRGGNFPPRGGRGSWTATASRFAPPPAPQPAPANAVPTGPRGSISGAISPSVPSNNKPFNPPTGPAAQGPGVQRLSLAQNIMAGMPQIIPGGRPDPAATPLTTGVTKDLESHHRRLREEEERIREGLRLKDDRLRVELRKWDRMEREAKSFELKTDLSDQSLKKIAGEGTAGAAF